MEYYIWIDLPEHECAWLDSSEPKELDSISWKMTEGIPVDNYPDGDVIWDLDIQKGKKPLDYVPNCCGIVVISSLLKNVLTENSTNYEYYPVKLRNSKKRVSQEQYWIANLLDIVHCTDMKNSDYRMSFIEPGQVGRFRRLVLDESKIPEDKKIFRLGEEKTVIVVRYDLLLELIKDKPKGHAGAFRPLKNFGAKWRTKDYKINEKVGY